MKNNKIKYLIFIFILLAISLIFYFSGNLQANNALEKEKKQVNEKEEVEKLPETRTELIIIEPGSTYGNLLTNKSDLEKELINQIYQSAFPVYDLAKIKADNVIELIYNYQDNELKALVYKFNNEEELFVDCSKQEFKAEIRPIPYEITVVTKEGEIASSLYSAALAEGIDEKVIISLAEAFQWTIDFAMDPRVGDGFRLIYEEKYLAGKYIRPGKVLAAKYINDEQLFYVYYFAGDKDNAGYFDENGNSVQKMFLKAPVAFKYISSGFTTGLRYVQKFNTYTGHRAIDYAAHIGTPIRSVGDGTITFAGWNGSYGYMVSVRHNGTYSTNYAHMSKMAVKYGDKVKQGEVIGYVGSTGFSTGPHLHYEMVKNGVKINPLTEVLPPGDPLTGDVLMAFKEYIKPLQTELGK